jgi:hypothetical protein
MFMIYHHTKFHVTNTGGSLVLPAIRKAECTFRAAAMLILYIKQNCYLNICYLLFKDFNCTTLQNSTLSGVTVASTSEFHTVYWC